MKPGSENLDDISPRDVAAYIRDVAEQLGRLSREMGLDGLAMALEHAQREAAVVLQENAAPEDAA